MRNMPGWAPGKLSVHEVILARQSKFLAAPTRGGPGVPKLEQIMARTTQNLDTAEYLETNFVTVGKTAAELSQPLPLKGRARTCHLRTVFYYDPEYYKPDVVETYDPEFKHASLKRTKKNSTNPGVHPIRWWKMGEPARQKAIDEFKAEKKGFFGLEDHGPRTELLKELGLDVPRPPMKYIMAAPAVSADELAGGHATGSEDDDIKNVPRMV